MSQHPAHIRAHRARGGARLAAAGEVQDSQQWHSTPHDARRHHRSQQPHSRHHHPGATTTNTTPGTRARQPAKPAAARAPTAASATTSAAAAAAAVAAAAARNDSLLARASSGSEASGSSGSGSASGSGSGSYEYCVVRLDPPPSPPPPGCCGIMWWNKSSPSRRATGGADAGAGGEVAVETREVHGESPVSPYTRGSVSPSQAAVATRAGAAAAAAAAAAAEGRGEEEWEEEEEEGGAVSLRRRFVADSTTRVDDATRVREWVTEPDATGEGGGGEPVDYEYEQAIRVSGYESDAGDGHSDIVLLEAVSQDVVGLRRELARTVGRCRLTTIKTRVSARGLHSSTFQLNLSRFCHHLHPRHPAYP